MPCYIISILIVVIYLPLSFSACSYSGLPSFKLNLKCRNGSVQVDIGSETYAVLNGSQTLRISRNMSQGSHTICSSEYGNNSSSPSKKCNPNMEARNINSFSCTSESIFLDTSKNYTWVHPTIQTRVPDFSRCSVTIIPIQEHILKDIDQFSQTLEDVKFSGFSDLNFNVSYFLNATSCDTCLRSQPPCGLPWRNHTCYCKDGMYRMDNCPAPAPLQLPGPAPAPSQLPGPAPAPLQIPGRNRNEGADPPKKRGTGTDLPKKLGLGLGAGGLSIFLTVLGVICYHKGCLSFTSKISWSRDTKDQRLVEIFVKNYGSMAPKRYSYSDIKKITNSFKDKIGQGGYGDVYKGKVAMGRLVAVKLLNKAKGNGEDFINEVASISMTSHVNIVSLLGFCFDGSKRALVYEFMVNGSLEKFIYDHNTLERQSHLGWDVLYKIAVGVARGLEYLHRGCNNLILHLDIKPHNILLDQDFNPKISDFGLAKLYPRDESIASMLNGRGTPGYTAPEMINRNFGRVSHKADVYSYGMMVLEMVGKRKNLNVGADHTSEIYFPQWIYKRLELDEDLVMHGVVSEEDEEIAKKMILVALWCIQSKPMDRPEMCRVEEMLEGKLDLLSIPPKPYLCSPPRSPPAGLPRHDLYYRT